MNFRWIRNDYAYLTLKWYLLTYDSLLLGTELLFHLDIIHVVKKFSLFFKKSLKIIIMLDFEVLTVVTLKSTVFWDVTLCCLVDVNKFLLGYVVFHRRRCSVHYDVHRNLLSYVV